MNAVEKVVAYITSGDDVLVFEQPDFPEAGVQVPGGTLEPWESPAQGVLREAFEETGLPGLRIVRYLGAVPHVTASGQHQLRHFFHLITPSRERETWQHWEQHPSTGGPPIRFRFEWVPRQRVPALAGGLDDMLTQLALGMDRATEHQLPNGNRIRYAARALLIDPAGRLLLLRAELQDQRLWVTPGGGLRPGEDFGSAALREIQEEVGATVELGPVVWLRRHAFEMPGYMLDQSERFFVARTETEAVAPVHQDSYVSGFRWWSLAELEASLDMFAPRALARHLPSILEWRYPNPPIDVGM